MLLRPETFSGWKQKNPIQTMSMIILQEEKLIFPAVQRQAEQRVSLVLDNKNRIGTLSKE